MSRYAVTRAVGAGVAAVLVGGTIASTFPGLLRTTQTEVGALPDDVELVTVRSSTGDVRVTEGDGGVSADLSYSYRRPELAVTDHGGGRAEVHVTGCRSWCGSDLQLELPPGVGVMVSTTFGDVEVSSSGPVTVRGTGSSVSVNGAPTSVDATTTLGDIQVDLDEAIPRLTLLSTLGDVTARLPGGTAYRVEARTSTGSPSVLVDRSDTSPHLVTVTTTLGDIRVENS